MSKTAEALIEQIVEGTGMRPAIQQLLKIVMDLRSDGYETRDIIDDHATDIAAVNGVYPDDLADQAWRAAKEKNLL